MCHAKKITTTITRVAFAEKMKAIAETGEFVEYKRQTPYWSKRLEGVVFPAEVVLLVGAVPYRFLAVSLEILDISSSDVPEYARVIVAATPGDAETLYAITCRPMPASRGAVDNRQTSLCDGCFGLVKSE